MYSIDPEMRGKSKSIRERDRYNQLVTDGKIKSEKKLITMNLDIYEIC